MLKVKLLPKGTVVDKMLKTPLRTIDPHANHRLPHLSKTSVINISAGNSVAHAIVNVRKTSKPKAPTLLTWPSKTSDMAILSFKKKKFVCLGF